MDIEELKNLLKSDEFKTLFDSDDFKELIVGSKHVQGLVQNKEQILTESKQYKDMLAAYKDLGDVEALKTAKDFYTKAEQDRVAKEGESKDTAVLAQLKSLQDKLQAMEQEKAQSLERSKQSAKDAFITKAIADAKGEPELLAHIVGKRVVADYEGEEIKFKILDKDGKDWAIDGNLASIDDLMKEVKSNSKWSKAFEPDVVSGTNTKQSNSNKKDNSPKLPANRKDFF